MSKRALSSDGSGTPLVSVVVPVYKNANTLQELHDALSRTFSDLATQCEMIYVDDACPQSSLEVLEELARSDPRVAVIALERNVGQQLALLTGLRFARGKQIVTMDADLQDPPQAIPALLERLQSGYAAVFAGRQGRYQSVLRMFTSRIFKTLLHAFIGVPRDAGAFVAINRVMADRLLAFRVEKPFIVSLIGFTGLPTTSIPVRRSQRRRGKSAYSDLDRLRTGLDALRQAFIWKWKPDRLYSHNMHDSTPIKVTLGSRFTTLEGG
jgi:glycosyltransferase involved in cell wall biosynthesis